MSGGFTLGGQVGELVGRSFGVGSRPAGLRIAVAPPEPQPIGPDGWRAPDGITRGSEEIARAVASLGPAGKRRFIEACGDEMASRLGIPWHITTTEGDPR